MTDTPPTPAQQLRQARAVMNVAWNEMIESGRKFREAEALFNERTDLYRKKYRIPEGKELSVEAILARSRDELWQVSVKDCAYQRERMAAYGLLHAAAVAQRTVLLEELADPT